MSSFGLEFNNFWFTSSIVLLSFIAISLSITYNIKKIEYNITSQRKLNNTIEENGIIVLKDEQAIINVEKGN